MEKCIDISAYQGLVSVSDFQKVKASGIPNVILRSSWTSQGSFSLHTDKVFDNNVRTAYKAGLKIGVYHYSQAITEAEAKKEAEYVLHTLARYRNYIKLPVAFDWEFGVRLSASKAKKLGKAKCGRICDSFCRVIRMGGYVPMVYANLSTLNAFIDNELSKRWKIWVAQYHSRCDYKHKYYMWQYSSSGRIPAISSGRIDMDYIYPDGDPKPKGTAYPGKLPALPKRGWFSSGDKGEQVKLLQKFLNWYGDYGLAVDGIVGRKTITAVRYYQGREKLKIDGAFGTQCLKRAKVVQR